MELWDRDVEPYAARLEALGGGALADLVLDAPASTIPLFEPQYDDFFPAAHRELIRSALHARVRDPAGRRDDAEFARDFLSRYDVLPEVAVRPAVGPFMIALVRLFEGGAPAASLSADDALECLSSCYEALLLSQASGRATIEDEERNRRCRQAIAVQTSLVLRALGSTTGP
ncbi:hypothetical protein ACWC10_17090 [Streptomyces sp. NPDC001595]|uniref:hypothetical protein n=1 Tax=Streptomyces sp. NPDC001532 TaxID=3154520 RepID=UPI003326CC08